MTNCSHGEAFDAIVIGTGFAGAVTAARLVQAGQRICVLERGRKYEPYDFPMYPKAESLQRVDGGTAEETEAPDLARWLWPVDQGLFDVRDLGDVVAVQAAGYGGGSLIYANVHLRAPAEVFQRDWPAEYRRETLDPYYDIAAYMLDVRPMPWRLAKTEQLLRAAKDLGREDDWFRPPLAVNFGEKKTNRWGRPQGKCDMRGQCSLGCRAQAKNSLDLNYLAIVEDAEVSGRPLADIRTQSEVRGIEKRSCEDCGCRFAVCYRDMLFAEYESEPEIKEVWAKHVFLCAGAVNSTELLMRSSGLLSGDTARRVGSRYHANCDSLAAVFDCDQPQEADLGPTVTGAMLYRDDTNLWALEFLTDRPVETPERTESIVCGKDRHLRLVDEAHFDFGDFTTPGSRGMFVVSEDAEGCAAGNKLTSRDGAKEYGTLVASARRLEDWLLIQDGGYPADIEPVLGILRSPLWLSRNRFRWQTGDGPAATPSGASTSAAAPRAMHQARQSSESAMARFPLPTALTALQGIPRRPVGMSASAPRLTQAIAEAQPLSINLDSLLPPWLSESFVADHKDMASALAPIVRPYVEKFINKVGTQLDRRLDLETLISNFGDSMTSEIGTLDDQTKGMLVRGLLQQGIQALWGSEAALAQRVNALLADGVPRTVQGWADLLAPLLGWLLNYRPGNGRTGVLLVMGRDRYRGRLLQQGPDGSLTARLPAPLADSSRVVEESVLRDIASSWRGELRTNPVSAILGRRLTVHSQGGCPMSSDPASAVTKSTGEVIGCDGLYVMDAAAFPSSVGVNPSATILAVAEHKIEHFIKNVLDVQPSKPAEDEVHAWLEELGKEVPRASGQTGSDEAHARSVLDPVPCTNPFPARAEVVGLSFSEVLSGQINGLDPGNPQMDWDSLNGFEPREIESFERAERRGAAEGGSVIAMTLKATIDDLDRFLSIQRHGLVENVPLSGTVEFNGPNKVCPETSYMQFFTRPSGRTDEAPVRFLRYRVAFGPDSPRYVIESSKFLRNDPRFDVWYDLSTLYFDLFENGATEPRMRGVMRVAPDVFVNQQLRSITVTPRDIDPSRQQWAYASFVRYFLGEVACVYVQRTNFIKDLIGDFVGVSPDH